MEQLKEVQKSTEKANREMKESFVEFDKRLSDLEPLVKEVPVVKKNVDSFAATCGKIKDKLTKSEKTVLELEIKVTKQEDILLLYKGRLLRMEHEVKCLKEEGLKLQCHSMKDNLVFTNIDESFEDRSEDTERVLTKFLEKEMKIPKEVLQKITLDRVHRMGRKNTRYNRPIVAKFNPYSGKEAVLKHTSNLDSSKNFGVNEQYPEEIRKRRDQVYPAYKEAKREGKKAKWFKDKVLVGKQFIYAPDDSSVTETGTDIDQIALNTSVYRTPVKNILDSEFKGHAVKLNDTNHVTSALHAIRRDPTAAMATHLVYAYKIKKENGQTEINYEDDREHGAGKRLFKILDDSGVDNVLVAVLRLFGGTELGYQRFGHYVDSGKEVLNIIRL